MNSSQFFSGAWAGCYASGAVIFAVDSVVNLPNNLAIGAAACVGTITCAMLTDENFQKLTNPAKKPEYIAFRQTSGRFVDRALNLGKASAFFFGGVVLGKEIFVHTVTKLAPSPILLVSSLGALAFSVVYAIKAIRPGLLNKNSSTSSAELHNS